MVPIDSDSKGLDERGPTDRIDATQRIASRTDIRMKPIHLLPMLGMISRDMDNPKARQSFAIAFFKVHDLRKARMLLNIRQRRDHDQTAPELSGRERLIGQASGGDDELGGQLLAATRNPSL
jgi:hypothetical protein